MARFLPTDRVCTRSVRVVRSCGGGGWLGYLLSNREQHRRYLFSGPLRAHQIGPLALLCAAACLCASRLLSV